MNVSLNNQLVDAINFLREDDKRFAAQIREQKKEIKKLENMIESSYISAVSKKELIEPVPPDEAGYGQMVTMILLLLFVWPVGIPYAIYFALTKKKRIRKNNEKFVRQTKEYENQIEAIEERVAPQRQKIEELESIISNTENERTAYYRDHGSCLLFIPKPYRNLKDVKRLYELVHEEYSFTLQDAIRRIEEERQEYIEMIERREEREREEERHRELQRSIEDQTRAITEEQRRTNEQLRELHEDNLRRRY